MNQTSESFREHGPHAVRPAPSVRDVSHAETVAARVNAELLDVEPPASSNGPAALRGDALMLALALVSR